jgi:hypothetical protein
MPSITDRVLEALRNAADNGQFFIGLTPEQIALDMCDGDSDLAGMTFVDVAAAVRTVQAIHFTPAEILEMQGDPRALRVLADRIDCNIATASAWGADCTAAEKRKLQLCAAADRIQAVWEGMQ